MDDLRWLSEAVKGNKRKLTSMERYEREVCIGGGSCHIRINFKPKQLPPPSPPPPSQLTARRFEWTPVHTVDFWRTNATAFEAGDFRLIKALSALLIDPGADDTTLAVALFDIGEFAVNHPQGRALLASLGVRPTVMALLKRDEDEVKQQALLACSKLLVTNWRFVGSGGGAAPGGTPVAAGGSSSK